MVFQKTFQTMDLPESAHTSCACYRTAENGTFPTHCHSYYELSFVISGERYEICGTGGGQSTAHRVADNSLFFIPPLAFHSNKNISPVEVLVIQFSQRFLSENSAGIGGLTLSRPKGASPRISVSSPRIRNALSDITDFCRENRAPSAAEDLRRSSLILELLSALIDSGELTLSENSRAAGSSDLDAVINHVLSHPDENTDMKKAARIANMSYYAFSRTFKETIGVNFSDYRNIIRIRLAEELLITTSLSVAEIAEKTGIGTQSYFSRLFKQQCGVSPTEYRVKYSLNKIIT